MHEPSHAAIVTANEATYAAWNAHDADAVAAVFAEDAVVVDVQGLLSQLMGGSTTSDGDADAVGEAGA